MKGQYTEQEMNSMTNKTHVSFTQITRRISNTVNYYRRESDNSWTNYHCRTIG